MKGIKVLIVDDHPMFILGIKSILVDDDTICVVGEARNGQEAYDLAKELRPDVVVMDLNMPVCDGLEGLRLIKAKFPEIKVIILTVNERDENLFEALKHGATGYLLKNILPTELVTFVHMAFRGETTISGVMATRIMHHFMRDEQKQYEDLAGSAPNKERGILTRREKEILHEVIKGLTNREIAETLYISENTVKNHMRNIMEKLSMNNRVQAAAYALREGLLQTDKLT